MIYEISSRNDSDKSDYYNNIRIKITLLWKLAETAVADDFLPGHGPVRHCDV